MHKSGKCLALSGTEGLPPVPNKADDAHRDYQNMRKLRSNRRRPRREAAPVPTAPPPSGGSPNHRAGGSPRGAREALTLQRLLRLLCRLWIKFQRCSLGRTLLHAFRNDYRKNIKKQPRHPKEITPIKSYQKYAYFAFPHAHVPYIIGEPPQNLV